MSMCPTNLFMHDVQDVYSLNLSILKNEDISNGSILTMLKEVSPILDKTRSVEDHDFVMFYNHLQISSEKKG